MAYLLTNSLHGDGFLSAFNFISSQDPSHGYVSYQSQQNAQAMGLYSVNPTTNAVRLGVDSTNVFPLSQGRPSLRLESNVAYNHGLFIADFAHMPPSTCGLWPAFWAYGDNWPNNGEVDIIEGVNTNTQNIISAHTRDGCIQSPSLLSSFTGELRTAMCAVGSDNIGCGYDPPSVDSSSYGNGFNAAGGGIYAMQWESDFISVWHFSREEIPADIGQKRPNPSKWGLPQAVFGGPTCNVDSFWRDMNLVININFCGDYGNAVWGKADSCNTLAPTCSEYVANNPKAFADAYWDVNYIDIYQLGAPVVSLPLPLQTSTSTSHSSSRAPTTTVTTTKQVESTSPVSMPVKPTTSTMPQISLSTAIVTSLVPHSSSTTTTSLIPHSTSSSLSRSTAQVDFSSSAMASRTSLTSETSSSLSRSTAQVSFSSSAMTSRTSLHSETSTAPSPTPSSAKPSTQMSSSTLNLSQTTQTRTMSANTAFASSSSSHPTSSAITSAPKSSSTVVSLLTSVDLLETASVSSSHSAPPTSSAGPMRPQSTQSKMSTVEVPIRWNATTLATERVTKSKPLTSTHLVMVSPVPETRSVGNVLHTIASVTTVTGHGHAENASVTKTTSVDDAWNWTHEVKTTPVTNIPTTSALATPSTFPHVASSSSQFPIAVGDSAETSILLATSRPMHPIAAPSQLTHPTTSSSCSTAKFITPASAPSRFHALPPSHNISSSAIFNHASGRPLPSKAALNHLPHAPITQIQVDSFPEPSQLTMGSAASSDFGRTRRSVVLAGLTALAVMMMANA